MACVYVAHIEADGERRQIITAQHKHAVQWALEYVEAELTEYQDEEGYELEIVELKRAKREISTLATLGALSVCIPSGHLTIDQWTLWDPVLRPERIGGGL